MFFTDNFSIISPELVKYKGFFEHFHIFVTDETSHLSPVMLAVVHNNITYWYLYYSFKGFLARGLAKIIIRFLVVLFSVYHLGSAIP